MSPSLTKHKEFSGWDNEFYYKQKTGNFPQYQPRYRGPKTWNITFQIQFHPLQDLYTLKTNSWIFLPHVQFFDPVQPLCNKDNSILKSLKSPPIW